MEVLNSARFAKGDAANLLRREIMAKKKGTACNKKRFQHEKTGMIG